VNPDEQAERQRILATLDMIIALATIELELEERNDAEKQRTRELLPPSSPRRARAIDPGWLEFWRRHAVA
jgi:hypothetical protein